MKAVRMHELGGGVDNEVLVGVKGCALNHPQW